MSDILHKKAMLNRHRRKKSHASPPIDTFLPAMDEGEVEQRAESSSLVEEAREAEDGGRLMSEEEITDLVQNALHRARRATESLSPSKRSLDLREPASPHYSSFIPSYVEDLLATKSQSARSTRALFDDESFFSTRQSSGGERTFDVEEDATYFGATHMVGAYGDMAQSMNAPSVKWVSPGLPSASDYIISSSEAILRRVEDEIENAKKAAREAGFRMTAVNSYGLATKPNESYNFSKSFDSDSFIVDADSVHQSFSPAQSADHSEIIHISESEEGEYLGTPNHYPRGFSAHGNAFMNVLEKANEEVVVIDLTDYSEDSTDTVEATSDFERQAALDQEMDSSGGENESQGGVTEQTLSGQIPVDPTAPVMASARPTSLASETPNNDHVAVESSGLVLAERNQGLVFTAPDEKCHTEPNQALEAITSEKKDDESSEKAKPKAEPTVTPSLSSTNTAAASGRAKSRIARLRQLKRSMGLLDDPETAKPPKREQKVEKDSEPEVEEEQSQQCQKTDVLDSNKQVSADAVEPAKTPDESPLDMPKRFGKILFFFSNAREAQDIEQTSSANLGKASEEPKSDSADDANPNPPFTFSIIEEFSTEVTKKVSAGHETADGSATKVKANPSLAYFDETRATGDFEKSSGLSPKEGIHSGYENDPVRSPLKTFSNKANERTIIESETTSLEQQEESENPEALFDSLTDSPTFESETTKMTNNLEQQEESENPEALFDSTTDSPTIESETTTIESGTTKMTNNEQQDESENPEALPDSRNDSTTIEYETTKKTSNLEQQDESENPQAPSDPANNSKQHPILAFFNEAREARVRELRDLEKTSILTPKNASVNYTAPPDASKDMNQHPIRSFFNEASEKRARELRAMQNISLFTPEDESDDETTTPADSANEASRSNPLLAFFNEVVESQTIEKPRRHETLQKVPDEATTPSDSNNNASPNALLEFLNDALESTKGKAVPKTTEGETKERITPKNHGKVSFLSGFFQGLAKPVVHEMESNDLDQIVAEESETKEDEPNCEADISDKLGVRKADSIDLTLSEILTDRSFIDTDAPQKEMREDEEEIDMLDHQEPGEKIGSKSVLDEEVSTNHQPHASHHENEQEAEKQFSQKQADETNETPSENPARIEIKAEDAAPVLDKIQPNTSVGMPYQESTAEDDGELEEDIATPIRKSESTPLSENEEKVHSVKQTFSSETQLHKKEESEMLILNPLGSLLPGGNHPPHGKPESTVKEVARCVQFKNRYDVPSLRADARSPEDIINNNKVAAPKCNLCLLDPKEEVRTLLDAIMGPSIARKFNACGALKMFSMNKKNQQTLARTDGFLDALIVAVSTDLAHEDYEAAYGTRSRALEILLKVCIPKDNRVIIFFHPDLVESIVSCAMEDDGETRMLACSVMAMLAKTHYLREPMARVVGLIDVLSIALLGLEDEEDIPGGEGSIIDSDDEDASDEGHSQTSDEASLSLDKNSEDLSHAFSGETSHASGSDLSNFSSEEGSLGSEGSNSARRIFEKKQKEREEMTMKASTNACAALLHLSKQCAAAVSDVFKFLLYCYCQGNLTVSSISFSAVCNVSQPDGTGCPTRCFPRIRKPNPYEVFGDSVQFDTLSIKH
jgi:hypothetical protein